MAHGSRQMHDSLVQRRNAAENGYMTLVLKVFRPKISKNSRKGPRGFSFQATTLECPRVKELRPSRDSLSLEVALQFISRLLDAGSWAVTQGSQQHFMEDPGDG